MAIPQLKSRVILAVDVMLKQKLKQIKEGRLSAEENIKRFIQKIRTENPRLNIVLHLNEKAIDEARKIDNKIRKGERAGGLAGLGVLVKSNINVEGLICNCASKTLENYKSGFDASVIKKLMDEDAVIIGMTNMDEFACGSSGETSAFGVCKNPRVLERIPGGTSSGSAAGVAAGFCDFALGSDTGGSIRNPASHCGVVGLKPSYGMVSRYGLIDLAMSFDVIGTLTESVEDCELVFNVIKGRDEKDGVSKDFKVRNKNINNIKIGVLGIKADDKIWKLIREKVGKVCSEKKWKFEDISLKYVDLGIQTYYPIAYTEFFSGTRKFDGRKYGSRIEDSCGEEVLRRILGGQEITKAEYSGKYYRRALAVRKLIKKEFEKAFNNPKNFSKKNFGARKSKNEEDFHGFDVLVMPTVPKLPHKLGSKISVEDMYNYDVCTVLANICEIPAVSVPCGFVEDKGEKIPVGLQLLGNVGEDDFLLKVAREFEG